MGRKTVAMGLEVEMGQRRASLVPCTEPMISPVRIVLWISFRTGGYPIEIMGLSPTLVSSGGLYSYGFLGPAMRKPKTRNSTGCRHSNISAPETGEKQSEGRTIQRGEEPLSKPTRTQPKAVLQRH